MTFLKISLLLTVIGLALWSATPPLCNGVMARVDIARSMVGPNGPMTKALEFFREDMGAYPDTSSGLAALIEAPRGVEQSRYEGPYLDSTVDVIADPWGKPYAYRAPGRFNKDTFDLYSFGPDGIDNGGRVDSDDITNRARSSARN